MEEPGKNREVLRLEAAAPGIGCWDGVLEAGPETSKHLRWRVTPDRSHIKGRRFPCFTSSCRMRPTAYLQPAAALLRAAVLCCDLIPRRRHQWGRQPPGRRPGDLRR